MGLHDIIGLLTLFVCGTTCGASGNSKSLNAFFGTDVEEIIDGVKSEFPYSFSQIHNDVNEFPPQSQGERQPPCDYARLMAYATCLNTNGCGASSSVDELQTCIIANCLSEVMEIFDNDSQECVDCLTVSFMNMFTCAAAGPVVGGRQINIGGLLLVSKRKLQDANYVDYFPQAKVTSSKGYLKAKIKDTAAVFCTHLTPTTSSVFFEPVLQAKGFTSYDDRNAFETNALIKGLRGIQPAIILGDFNTGFAFKPNQQPSIKESYVQLLKRFTTMPAIDFTWRDPADSSRQSCIDHVFVKNMIIRNVKRLFVPRKDQALMSDHVAVQAVVKAV